MDTVLFVSALVLGAGLAVDVAIATTVRFRDNTLNFLDWTIPVVVLHILFISGSYLFSFGATQNFPMLQPVVGVIGFLLVLWLLNKVTREALGQEHKSRVMDWLEERGISEHSASRTVVLVAITLDALVSGPVIAPWINQLNSITDYCIFFLVVGAGVGIITQIAVGVAKALRRRHFHSPEKMATWFVKAKYIELSVIGGFGVAAPWESILGDSNLYLSILFVAIVMGFIWFRNYDAIYINELKEAEEAIAGTR